MARRSEYHWAENAFTGVRVAEFKFLVKDQVVEYDDMWPRLSPFQARAPRDSQMSQGR